MWQIWFYTKSLASNLERGASKTVKFLVPIVAVYWIIAQDYFLLFLIFRWNIKSGVVFIMRKEHTMER